ncbi:dienelactone hydrolase family protein [Orrella sp. JC864]|uniref:dienelactone hydrolase family protein n=1 Tax=Orrella sp. JC864 TaxID=3120298 RepID=UPI00300B4BBE
MSHVTLKSKEGKEFKAYYAKGPSASARGIVLIQEIFGINQAMRELADQWAAKGYHVICPDLFWRQEAGLELDPTDEKQFARGYELMQGMKGDETMADLESARAWLAQESGHDKIAAIGYCMGGMLSVKAACETPVKCAVSYYGVNLDTLLENAPANCAPMLLHVAGKDRFVPPEAREKVIQLAAAHAQVTAHVYEHCDHAFSRPGGQHYDAQAAKQAEERSHTFLAQHLA